MQILEQAAASYEKNNPGLLGQRTSIFSTLLEEEYLLPEFFDRWGKVERSADGKVITGFGCEHGIYRIATFPRVAVSCSYHGDLAGLGSSIDEFRRMRRWDELKRGVLGPLLSFLIVAFGSLRGARESWPARAKRFALPAILCGCAAVVIFHSILLHVVPSLVFAKDGTHVPAKVSFWLIFAGSLLQIGVSIARKDYDHLLPALFAGIGIPLTIAIVAMTRNEALPIVGFFSAYLLISLSAIRSAIDRKGS